jgi:FlaA1/EpsC-like NDP-sugar epimerase
LILLGRGENRIHAIYYELREQFPDIFFEPVICNITSKSAIDDVLRQHKPSVIFHTAAHKHVFLMECNPVEAVQNNVLGTAVLTASAAAHGVERFVLISTDKATEPASVMGATKTFCECLAAHRNHSSQDTKFITVRFGNVLGSAGSVVPIFQAQVRSGRPLTVTDPAADRYFMTIAEASFMVLQAGALGQGGEVYVLDMGTPVKITDIARIFLQLHDIDPDTPGAIEYIGLRAGEKLHETLVNPYEQLVETDCPQVCRAAKNGSAPIWLPVEEALEQFEAAVRTCDDAAVLTVLAQATGAHFDAQPRLQ